MKRMTIPAMLVAAVLAFTLAGCAGGNSAQTMDGNTMKGYWTLDSGTDLGFDAYVNLADDSEVEMILYDSYLEGTWTVSGKDGSLVLDGRTVKMSYSNNKMILGSSDGSKLVFTKDNSEETKLIFEGGYLSSDEYELDTTEIVDEVIEPVDPFVIVDNDQVKMTVTGIGTDYTNDPCYQLEIVNKLDRDIFLMGDEDFKVGDKAMDAGLGDTVEKNSTLTTTMYFDRTELGGGPELLTVTDGTVLVLDDNTDEELGTFKFHYER